MDGVDQVKLAIPDTFRGGRAVLWLWLGSTLERRSFWRILRGARLAWFVKARCHAPRAQPDSPSGWCGSSPNCENYVTNRYDNARGEVIDLGTPPRAKPEEV